MSKPDIKLFYFDEKGRVLNEGEGGNGMLMFETLIRPDGSLTRLAAISIVPDDEKDKDRIKREIDSGFSKL